LLWLAWKIATAHGANTVTGGKPIGFFGAAAFQWVNPKSWLICTSAAATFLDQRAGSAFGQSAAFASRSCWPPLRAFFPWLAFGAVMQRWLRVGARPAHLQRRDGVLLAASVIFDHPLGSVPRCATGTLFGRGRLCARPIRAPG